MNVLAQFYQAISLRHICTGCHSKTTTAEQASSGQRYFRQNKKISEELAEKTTNQGLDQDQDLVVLV